MIEGIVRSNHPQSTTGSAFVTIAVKPINSDLPATRITAVVDTGFDGYLTLPERIINDMKLQPVGIQSFVLGDNNEVRFKCYLAEAHWGDEARMVRILQSESHPLIGMNLLWGHWFSMDTRHDGPVTIG